MSWSGFKKNVGRATTQVMMKTGHVEKTSDREYEVEERRYRTLESASLRLQKEAKGYLDSLRAMTASQMRIAETIDAFYGDSGAKDGVSRSYKQAVEDLDAETVKALDGPYRCVIQDYPLLRKEVEKRFPHEEWDFVDHHLSEVDAELNWKSKERTFSRNTAYYESQSYDQGTVELIDVIYRTTVLEPINRFCAYFPDINECIKKRNHKMLDYDAMRSKVKKLTEKPDKDPAKLPRTEKETEMVGDPSSFLDLPTDHLNRLDDDDSSMLHSPPQALDGIHHHRLRLAKLEVDEQIALDSVGAPTSLKVKRKSSLLRRISGVSDAFWGRTDAQKRVTVAGELSQTPLSPIAVSRHFSSASQRSPLPDLPDIDESSTNFLSPVSSPVMMGGGLIPAISPHSTHAPTSKRSSEPVRTRSASGGSFSLFKRSPKETPTRNTSTPLVTSQSPADGLGISGYSTSPDYTPTRLSSMTSQLMNNSGGSDRSDHPLFKRSPDGTPTRSSAMPGSMKKSSPLDTPTHLRNTPARMKTRPPDETPSRAAPPRFTVTSAASSEVDAETIRSSGASWQTTYSEVSENERKDSMDPYTKNSDAVTLATLTSSSFNDQDFYTVDERSSMDLPAETDYCESIADTDYGESFDEHEPDEHLTETNDGDSTLVDFASASENSHVALSNGERCNSDTVASDHDQDHSSSLDIDAVIQAIDTPSSHKRQSIMKPRKATSNDRRDHASFINFLKRGPPGASKKPVKKFKPPPRVLPPLFGRPYSAASACPEPLFSPRSHGVPQIPPQTRPQGPSKGVFFQPSELEDIMQPLKEEFAQKQADLLKQAKVAYDQLNEQLTNELPQLIDLRVPYLDPSFEALVKIQLRFCAEAYSRMAQVQQYLAAETREQYASGDLDARVEDVLGQIRELSIAGTV